MCENGTGQTALHSSLPSSSSEQNRQGAKDAKRGEMRELLGERDDVGENVECKARSQVSDRFRENRRQPPAPEGS